MSEPLAAALRPKTLDAFVGQPHLMAKDAPFRKSIENEFSSSVLLWGPPGCGKTTLALILAARSKRQFVRLSAVSDGMNDLRKHVQNAHARHRLDGSGLLMFVDEIHRWNKAQQDALLPHVESGLILLIGATTENPSFSVIPALRSRCWTLPLHPLEIDDLCRTLERGCKHLDLTLPQTHLKHIARYSGGDARRALSLLERVSCASSGAIKEEELFLLLGNKDTLHDSSGEMHYNVTSAFIKSMRGSDPDAALYWMARLLQAGEDPMFVARRMVIFASEDIGNADLRALPIATAALQSTHFPSLNCSPLFPLSMTHRSALHLARH